MPLGLTSELKARLIACNQNHLVEHVERLSADAGGRLVGQLETIDWDQLKRWIDEYVVNYTEPPLPSSIEAAPYFPLVPATPEQRVQYSEARTRGKNLLTASKVGGFLVAGGQGTRLGYEGPKGTFPVSPVKGKTLFQIFAEKIARAQEKYGAEIPWYIMTSPMNHQPTVDFFAANRFFGLSAAQVMFFPQGTLPAIGLDGRLLLASADSLALSPNGHGGSLLALRDSGALADMRKRGIEHITYWQVDNPLVHIFDPLFIGLHDQTGSEMSSRSLTKTGPKEKLGNFCIIDGDHLGVIEYSDMPDELAEARDADGSLVFRAGSPAIHMLRRSFVERITGSALSLPPHRAVKKVNCVDREGREVQPSEPNAVKLEMFIFDALPLAENPAILEADRSEQFAPVKNLTGIDSVVSCRELMQERDARWLENAGVPVPRDENGKLVCMLELSPRRFLDEEDVKNAWTQINPPQQNRENYYS